MSTLKELLKDVPVEWKALENVTSVLRGRRLTKSQLTSEGYPVFHGGLEPLGYYKEYNRNANSVMIINVGASAGNVGFSSNDFWSSDGCYCLAQVETINSRYLFYFLLGNEYYLKSKVRYAGIPTLDSAIIQKLQIPIPYPNDPEKSLAIQQEIVRVLDSLSEQNKALTTALAQEIDQRKKQYEYYREELFRFEGKKVEWKMVGEYVDYLQPTNYLVSSKNYHDDYKTPVLTAGKTFILGYTDEPTGIFPAAKSPVIIFDDFTTANKWVDFDFKAKSSAMKILIPKDDSKIILKYFYYWLNSCPSELADGDHKRQWISNYSLKLFPIPYPNEPEKSLAIQQEIVRVLDSLSEQNKALTSALAQEIELRNKQYEYYRNLLLSFPN